MSSAVRLRLAFAFIVAVSAARPVPASCLASLTLNQISPGRYAGTAIGQGSCGANGNHVEILLRENGGGYGLVKSCPDGLCQFDFSFAASCAGNQTIELAVRCSRQAGELCVPDEDGHDIKTVQGNHANNLSLGKAVEYLTVGGGAGLSGVLKVHAPAAWTARVIHYDWLMPDGTSFREGSQPVGSPDLDDVDVNFTNTSPARGGTLVATLDSCSDTFSPLVLDAGGDHQCDDCDRHQPPACQNCVAKPIRLHEGDMQITQADPLPGFSGMPMKRTYHSLGPSLTWFGMNWSSIFDRALFIYPNVVGGPWAVLWLDGSKRYVFRPVNGHWVQQWPLGRHPAVLTTDPSTGLYTLQEPERDLEIVIEPQNGLPVSYRSRSTGRALTITYNGTTPAHAGDSWGTFGWTIVSSNHRIDSIAVDGTSLSWQYVYSGGSLTAVNGPGGAAWRTYTYSGNLLAEARDAAGKLLESHAYDGFGRATSSLQSEDDVQSISYDAATRNGGAEELTAVQSATGAVTNYWIAYFGGRARVVEIEGNCTSCGVNNAVFAYKPGSYTEPGGQLLRMQDARGYITEWTYDANDRVIAVTRGRKPTSCNPETDALRCHQSPAGLLTLALGSTSATETTTYVYGDANWPDRPTLIGRPSVSYPGQVTTEAFTYDAQSGTVLTHTTRGWDGTTFKTHVTTSVLYSGSEGAAFNPGGAFSVAWLTLPQPLGLVKSSAGPRTDVTDLTRWVYYPVDNAVPAFWRGRVAAVRNAAGHDTRFENYDVFGNATRVIDANGVVTEMTFDPMGRLLTSTIKAVAGCDTNLDPLCATDLTTTRTYQSTYGPLGSETRPSGAMTTYEYDARGRLQAIVRPVSTSLSERLEYDYDPATGRKSAERFRSGSTGSWITARSEAFRYDLYGRLLAVDHPDGKSISYTYDAANNLASVQDENHTAANTTYKYDPVNRLERDTQTLTGTSGVITQYAYDLHGNLASVIDPNGNTTTYGFDDFGRMTSQVSPVTGTTTYVYDPSGNLISTTDANGATTARAYDALNRVVSATSSRSGMSTEVVGYLYDEDLCGTGNVIGRLSMMEDPTGGAIYCYERRGLMTAESAALGVSYGYDLNGNRSSILYPSGRLLTYTFDLADRPRAAVLDGADIITSASYHPFGPIRQLAFGNGTTKTMTLDNRYRPLENKLTGPSGTLAEYDYIHDAAGNITQIHDAVDAAYNRDFGYDDLNRLTSAASGSALWGTGGYQYDEMGNMKSLQLGTTSQSFSYVGTTSKLQGMVYDNAGNETGGDDMLYGPRNLMTKHGSGFGGQGHWINYGYDGRGVRVSSSEHSSSSPYPVVRRYAYSPELHLLANYSEMSVFLDDGPLQGDDYVWFGDQPVAQMLADASLRYTFTDHLGTPLLQTDPAASIVWRAEYEPYGKVYSYRAGDALDPQTLRFPGQESDSYDHGETLYNVFRWYRAGWGRYTSPDPIELLPGPNLYSYTFGNPIRYSDRFGLFRSPMPTPTIPYPQTLPPPGCSPAPPSWGPGTLGGVGTVLWAFFFDPPALNQTGAELPDPAPGHCRGCPKGAEDDRDDRCYDQWIREDHRCEQWWRGGSEVVQDYRRACKQSAFTRYSECLRHGTPRSPLSPRPDQQ